MYITDSDLNITLSSITIILISLFVLVLGLGCDEYERNNLFSNLKENKLNTKIVLIKEKSSTKVDNKYSETIKTTDGVYIINSDLQYCKKKSFEGLNIDDRVMVTTCDYGNYTLLIDYEKK